MRALEPWHLIVLLVVVLILFGGKRLPDAARGLGRSMRIFKSEVKQMHDDDTPRQAHLARRGAHRRAARRSPRDPARGRPHG